MDIISVVRHFSWKMMKKKTKQNAIFYSIEKKNYENKNIQKLIDNNKNPKDILTETVAFYKNLYSVDARVSTEYYEYFFKLDHIPKISIEARDKINRPLPFLKLKTAVNSMKNDKHQAVTV